MELLGRTESVEGEQKAAYHTRNQTLEDTTVPEGMQHHVSICVSLHLSVDGYHYYLQLRICYHAGVDQSSLSVHY